MHSLPFSIRMSWYVRIVARLVQSYSVARIGSQSARRCSRSLHGLHEPYSSTARQASLPSMRCVDHFPSWGLSSRGTESSRSTCHIPKGCPVLPQETREADMITWVLHRAIDKFERDWNCHAGHRRHDASPRPPWVFSRVTNMLAAAALVGALGLAAPAAASASVQQAAASVPTLTPGRIVASTAAVV